MNIFGWTTEMSFQCICCIYVVQWLEERIYITYAEVIILHQVLWILMLHGNFPLNTTLSKNVLTVLYNIIMSTYDIVVQCINFIVWVGFLFFKHGFFSSFGKPWFNNTSWFVLKLGTLEHKQIETQIHIVHEQTPENIPRWSER